jgi:two-component system response regulator GlrR
MQTIRCAVGVAARHLKWSEWAVAELQRRGRCRVEAVHLTAGDRGVLQAELSATDPELLLLFVTPDSVAWAGRLLRSVRAVAGPGLPALLITRGLAALAIEQLLHDGASDFLPSPWEDEELMARIERLRGGASAGAAALPTGATPATVATAASGATAAVSAASLASLAPLIGRNAGFRQQVERLPAMAACQAAVLLLGETGTGKELFAQALHYLGPRAHGPWIAVNCGALPPDLVEAELFGHARGAYTSAHQAREGLVAEAEGGTLFLDEIDSLPLASQGKLLRFLQDKEYRPVGASELRRAQVRIVSASNIDLQAQVQAGAFRGDLYFRLNVLRLPALRERSDDILDLARHFVQRHAREFERVPPVLGPAACQALLAHRWPGNVRELSHCLERAVLLCRGGTIVPEDLDLPAPAWPDSAAGPAGFESDAASFQAAKARAIEAFERQYLEQVLRRCAGNINQAAVAASKNRRAFFELMRKHRIDAQVYRR